MGASAVAGGLFLFSATAPVALAKDGSSQLMLAGTEQAGGWMEFTLVNAGVGALAGQLVLEVEIDGRRALALIPFFVWGGQKVSVSWAPTAPEERIIQVGIIVDDGAPI
jgi:hypothetical protein